MQLIFASSVYTSTSIDANHTQGLTNDAYLVSALVWLACLTIFCCVILLDVATCLHL